MSVLTNASSDANSNAGAYATAILELLGDSDPRRILQKTARRLRDAVEGRSDQSLRRPEAQGKWSAIEIIQHLADSEVAWAWRLRSVIAQDRAEITGYDQDAWAAALRYKEADLEPAIRQFEVLRESHLRLLEGLDDSTLAHVGVHRERGEESIKYMIRLHAGHDLVHLRQLDRVLAATS